LSLQSKTKIKILIKMINNNIILIMLSLLLNLIDVLTVILPILLAVAFMTIIERKQLAAHQRRVGPNTVGYYGLLQPFADALKLILKETVIPSQSNKVLFYLAPISTLVFSLLG
jgi:NADH-ubiquinone oxidoreductase chain 1